ncbi:YitT family protein [Hathewaya limosa]|uniref:Uncharacterized membrane-anchored protein YitT (DUF2179 family) n=1 Tax=Hathewaya limosa TaxID=1536 RepID=A0ABU0JR01_HATLI|nr:YitT family protein [Hathewaya limosa]MDQ0479524.1 uncharacterized membrane-anchored protein YitT (DUF2179 family) [Hathewaya limosa]
MKGLKKEIKFKEFFTKERTYRLFMIILGTFIYSLSVNLFITPHKLIAGGVTGVAIIIQYLTYIPSGIFVFLLNIPLFIMGIKFLDKEFGICSFIGMMSMSLFLVITKDFTKAYHMNDILLSSICGGVIGGLGMGIVFRCRGSEGGTDIISVIVKKKYGVTIGTISFIINICIVILGAVVGGSIEIAIYTIISMYMKSAFMDKVIEGLDRKKMLFVITKKPEEVKEVILNKLGRGVTFLNGQGAYTGEDKKIIYSVMSSKQLAKGKELINKIDPTAVITIMEVAEVQGKGFKSVSF